MIVENQQSFCLQLILPDTLYLSTTQQSNQPLPSVPRMYLIQIDRKIPSSIHLLPPADEFLQSHVKTRKPDLIDHIAPTKLPSRCYSRSIVAKKSIHCFFSYNQQASQNDWMDIKPKKESKNMAMRHQFRLKYIEEDSLASTNTRPFAFDGVKNFSFCELSSPFLLDIRKKRKLNGRKMQMMPSRSVLRYRTVSSIMKKYKLNGGAFIPHVNNENSSFDVSQDFITKNDAPILKSILMKQKNKDMTRKISPRSNLHYMNSKTIIDYSRQNHLPLLKQIDENNISFSHLLSRFEMPQTISIEVRGELLHLQKKSSEIGQQGKVCCFDSDIADEKKIILTEDNKDNVTVSLHKQDIKRRRRSSKERSDEDRKKKRKKRKRQKSIKHGSESKKRKRKVETKKNSINLIEVPSLQVGATPMIITHSKYEITSIQKENKICRQQLFRRDVQVQMTTDREGPRVATSNIPSDETPVVLPKNEADDEVNIMPDRSDTQLKRSDLYMSICPLSTSKYLIPPHDSSKIQKIANGKNTPSEFGGNQQHLNSLRNSEVQVPYSSNSRRLTHDGSNPDIIQNGEQLWLFCSEQFIETWSQTATELSSGKWVHHIWNDESTQITRSSSQYQIHLKDCLLLDDCQVDIEFPNRTAVKVIQFGDQNCSDQSIIETNPKSIIKTIVNLAASDRYCTIHLIMVLHTTETSKYLSDIANLQNAIVKQQGCPCDNLFFQYTQPALLSTVIATISSKHLKNDLLANIDIETRIIEKARFLLSIVPTLTAFDCIVLLSKRNMTLKDHIQSIMSISCNHEIVRKDTTRQVRAALGVHLDGL